MAKRHDWRYFFTQVATGKENYYTGAVERGEPPGVWQGRAAADLGLAGEVDEPSMEALFEHRIDPRDSGFRDPAAWATASKLGSPYRDYSRSRQVRLAALLEAEPDATPERVEQLRLRVDKESRRAVIYFDVTLSPQKSVSVLHAAFQAMEAAATKAGDAKEAARWARCVAAAEQAVWAANTAMLEYLQDEAGYSRVGNHSVRAPGGESVGRYVDAHAFTVASFFQHTSRSEDMQLHIHNAIWNRVQCPDGKWRSIDGTGLYRARPAATAYASRVLEERLTRELGVQWAMRPDGKAREIVGISPQVRDTFSQRKLAIGPEVEQLAAAWEHKYGTAPNALQLSRLTKQAVLSTRPFKRQTVESHVARLHRWERRLRREVRRTFAEIATTVPWRIRDPERIAQRFNPQAVIDAALADVAATKATWTRYDLLKAINTHLPDCLGGLDPTQLRRLLEHLTDQALQPGSSTSSGGGEVVPITAPEVVPAPAQLRRADGLSMWQAHGAQRFTTAGTLAAEQQLHHALNTPPGTAKVDHVRAVHLIDQAAASVAVAGHTFGSDQAAVLRSLLTSGRPVEVLNGPAGAGKSVTIGMLADLWQRGTGGQVLGLAPSQLATTVLTEDGFATTANIPRWLAAQDRLTAGSTFPEDQAIAVKAGDLVVVDEYSMVNTVDLARIHAICRRAGAKLLLAGDDRQLAPVGPGGSLDLTGDVAVHHIREVRRFTNEWERDASLRLRGADDTVLTVYDRHGRWVDAGTTDEAATAAARAWLADTLDGKASLLVVDTNGQAAALSAHVRADLQRLGRVEHGGVPLHDGTHAGVGDTVQARLNDWNRDIPVINRELYQVTDRRRDGSLTVRRLNHTAPTGPALTLTADYVAGHVTLGYATTVYGAQGATVDTCHGVITPRTSGHALYVQMTRGRTLNVGYVATAEIADRAPILPQPEDGRLRPGEVRRPVLQILADILDRYQPEPSATQALRDEFTAAESLQRLGVIWSDVVAMIDEGRYNDLFAELPTRRLLTATQHRSFVTDPACGPLRRLLRAAELAGHNPRQVLIDAIRQRELDTAGSIAEVLHHRVTARLRGRLTPTGDTYTDRTPTTTGPLGEYARQLAHAIDQRTTELGEQAASDPPPWALQHLGPPPDDPTRRLEWNIRAGRVAGYREHHHHTDPDNAIGPVPPVGAPEARAAWHTAWRALGTPRTTRREAAMTVPQLRQAITVWRREQAWAPDWVGDELRRTAIAERHHRQEATLHHAGADIASPGVAGRYRQLADGLAEQHQRLQAIDRIRTLWHEHTRPVREAAERATAELRLRGLDPEAARTTTAVEVADQTAPDIAGPLHQLASQVADRAAAVRGQAPSQDRGQQPAADADGRPRWPDGVPSLDRTVQAVQRANQALRTIRQRQVEAQRRHEPDHDQHHHRDANPTESEVEI